MNLLDRVKRVDYHRSSVGNMAESEGKVDYDLGRGILTDNASDSWGKRRRVDYDDDRFLMGNVIENDGLDDSVLGQTLWCEHNRDSLGKERRVADSGQFLTGDRIKIECEIDNVNGPSISTDYLENSFNKVRREGDGGLLMNNNSPLHRVKLTTDDGGLFMNNNSVENECSIDNGFGPVRNAHRRGTLLRNRGNSDGWFFSNDRLENEHHVDRGIGNYVGRRESDVGTFLVKDREHNEHKLDNNFGSVISTDYSRYTLDEDRLIANDGRFRNDDKDIGNFLCRPIISKDHTAFSQSKQNPLVYSSQPFIETEYSSALARVKEVPLFDRTYQTVAYDPDVPDIFHTQPLPFGPRSYKGSDGNYRSPSRSRSTPRRSKLENLSRCLDVTPGYGNKVPLPEVLSDFQKMNRGPTPIRISNASNRWDCPFYGTGNTHSNTGYSESIEFKNSGMLFSDPSLDYIPLSECETREKENNALSYALSSIKDSSFAFNNRYPVESENNKAVTRKEFSSPDASGSRFEYAAKPSETRDENSPYRSSGGMRCDNKNDRTSVFARLSLAPKVRAQEQEINSWVVYDDYDMDASVDDVMDLLRQSHSQNHQIKIRKHKLLARRYDNGENIRANNFFDIHDQIKYEQSMMMSSKNKDDAEMEIDVNQIIEKSGEPLLEETRLVDFKRRSEIKKNLSETTTKDSVNTETKGPCGNKSADNAQGLVSKPHKRRKLIRPDFSKKDPIDESTLNLILPPSHSNSLSPKNEGSCENNVMSPNVELVQATCSTSCDGDDNIADQNSVCLEKENLDNCEDGREASNDILNRLSHLLSKVRNRNNVGDCSSNEVPIADLTSQESPVDVYEVTDNRENCRGNEDLTQDP